MTETQRFVDRTIIVTGAGSGIGRATALRLVGEGASVVASDLSAERLGEVAVAAESTSGRLITVPGDVGDASTPAQLLEVAAGHVDGLVNNVASIAGLRASASGVAYSVSKAGLIAMTKSVAFFHGREGVRCNAVAPGAVATNIEARFHADHAENLIGPAMRANIPDFGTPEQSASAITYLLSDDASFVNGVVLPVDAGWSVS